MITRRLMRVFERGGAAFLNRNGSFDVRRSTDARSGVIGVLDAADLTGLKRQGYLKRFGEIEPPRYIWSGRRWTAETLSKASVDGFLRHDAALPTSLAEQVLASLADPDERERLNRSARYFCDDFRWVDQGVRISGMNWSALALGGRIEGGLAGEDSRADPLYKVAAERRLKHIEKQLSRRGYRQLTMLLVDKTLPKRFAANYGMRSHEAPVRTVDLLRRLSWVYEKELKPPECVDRV